jgi:hypothetical protein
MIRSDFVSTTSTEPDRDLKLLLETNSRNRMAFEYLMAYYLLDGKVGKFITNIKRLIELNYNKIPRSYEEALILYIAESGKKQVELPGYSLSYETINRFNDFRKIYERYNSNKLVARTALTEKYAGTYWYYVMYEKPRSTADAGS